MVRFPPIGDGHDGRDVSQPPPDLEVVFGLLRRLGRRRDEARELRNVTNPETADVDRQHPSRLRNVQMVVEADVAPSANPESRMVVDAVAPVIEMFFAGESHQTHSSEEGVVVVLPRA